MEIKISIRKTNQQQVKRINDIINEVIIKSLSFNKTLKELTEIT